MKNSNRWLFSQLKSDDIINQVIPKTRKGNEYKVDKTSPIPINWRSPDCSISSGQNRKTIFDRIFGITIELDGSEEKFSDILRKLYEP